MTGMSVPDRIERRLHLLRSFVASGIPDGVAVPRSLTRCRVWEAPELGIEAIPNPNLFTKTHPRHGTSVAEIEGLIDSLARQSLVTATEDAGAGVTREVSRARDRKRFKVEKERLAAVASQWQTERARVCELQIALDDARRRLRQLSTPNP